MDWSSAAQQQAAATHWGTVGKYSSFRKLLLNQLLNQHKRNKKRWWEKSTSIDGKSVWKSIICESSSCEQRKASHPVSRVSSLKQQKGSVWSRQPASPQKASKQITQNSNMNNMTSQKDENENNKGSPAVHSPHKSTAKPAQKTSTYYTWVMVGEIQRFNNNNKHST